MSKQFESKKESAIRINKFISALESDRIPDEDLNELKYKYNLLLKKHNDLENVYEFHRGIIQNISSGILTIDMQGKITFMNSASLEILGYDYQGIQGKNIEILFADVKEGKKILQKILNDKVMYESKETHLLTKNEKVIPIGFSTTRLNHSDNNESDGIIFIFRDISMINNLRKQLERMERLATLGELSAGIAHEIRNPLAGIKTSAQVLEETFSPGDFRSQLVSRIVKEIDRSNELLKRMFNFARPSKPRQDFYNVEMIIDGVYLLLAPRFKKKNITFKTNFMNETPQVFVDESQFEQVILNIFLNAIDAMKDGGQICVETGVIDQIRLQEDRGKESAVYVRISDTGIGVPVEKLEKIFNPFYTTKSDGVGLGLSISTRLIEENGGKVEAESKPGEGTTINIYIPIITQTQGVS